MSKITTGLIRESLFLRLDLKLKLLDQIPQYEQISNTELSKLYRSAFLNFATEVDNFCFILIWNRHLYRSLSKEARKSFMRKAIWDLRCKGIVFDDSDLVT